jgi:hypothetical protein
MCKFSAAFLEVVRTHVAYHVVISSGYVEMLSAVLHMPY